MYLSAMIQLTDLSLNLENNSIGNEKINILVNSLMNLNNLDELELNLKDNYIDNVGFELIVDNLE